MVRCVGGRRESGCDAQRRHEIRTARRVGPDMTKDHDLGRGKDGHRLTWCFILVSWCLFLVPHAGTKTRVRCVGGHVDGETQSIHDLLDTWLRQANRSDLIVDALDSCAPSLHDPSFSEDASERRISQAGCPPHRVDRHTWKQQAGAVDLNAIVVEPNAYGRTAFSVAGVNESIDNDLADRLDRDRVGVRDGAPRRTPQTCTRA